MSVVIPSYQRADWLPRAVASLGAQARLPDEVIVVARDTDVATHAAIAALRTGRLPFSLRAGTVSEPGFMPPVFEGIRLASHDVVAFMDDDAEAEPGWTEGLLRHYADPSVGGVGGRYLNVRDDVPIPVPLTSRVGTVTWLGRFVGNMYMTPAFNSARDVEFLVGGCMSYRREVARALEFDAGLNRDVAFGYEVDLGLQVRRAGWRLVFDPSVVVRHHSAPRAVEGMRANSGVATRAYAHNQLRVALRRLPWPRALAAGVRAVLVGERRAPGVALLALGPVARTLGFEMAVARDALAGRLEAVRSVLRPSKSTWRSPGDP